MVICRRKEKAFDDEEQDFVDYLDDGRSSARLSIKSERLDKHRESTRHEMKKLK
jgi:hypothetical protein